MVDLSENPPLPSLFSLDMASWSLTEGLGCCFVIYRLVIIKKVPVVFRLLYWSLSVGSGLVGGLGFGIRLGRIFAHVYRAVGDVSAVVRVM